MPARSLADRRPAADRRLAAPATARGDAKAEVYLTDGVFLYRVVGLVASETGGMVELEDCYWLDVVRVSIGDLRARRLRVVTPTPAQS